MSRVRSIYNNLAVYAGPSPANGAHVTNDIKQLHRLQGANWNFSINRENVNSLGQLAALSRVVLNSPDVSFDFSYLITDLQNELNLGFSVNSGVSALSNILQKIGDDRNYFVLLVGEGEDAVGKGGGDGAVIGIGNGFLSSYSIEGAVGSFPSASVAVEGLNIRAYADGTAQEIPAIDPANGTNVTGVNFTIPTATSGAAGQAAALKPGDITVTLNNDAILFEDKDDICVQSFNISVDLTREPIQCLGTAFAVSREIQFPIDVSLNVDAIAGDITTGNLADYLCEDSGYDLAVTLRQPVCGTGIGAVAAKFDLKNARLDSTNWSNSIGPNETVSLTWTTQIGASGDTTNGLFMTGITGYA